MANAPPTAPPGFVRKETLAAGIAVSLIVGFRGGVLLGIYGSSPAPGMGRSPGGMRPPAGSEDLKARIPAAEAAAREDPGNPSAWAALGNLYFDTGEPEKAIEAYRRSLDLSPDNPAVWTDMGIMYREAGKPREAVEAFDRAMKLDSRHENSRFNKGIVLLHDLQDPEGAIRAWEDLLAVNPLAVAPGGQSVDMMVHNLKKARRAAPKP